MHLIKLVRWRLKEKDYQKDLKSLEILLSKKEGGMEDVSLARTQSIVHGSQRAADIFEDGLDKIKKNIARYSSGGGEHVRHSPSFHHSNN
jgi:hypothetical protein